MIGHWLTGLILLAPAAAADEVTMLQVGQAVWRQHCPVQPRRLPDGSTRAVQTELYGLVLDQAETVRVTLQSEARLGVLIKSVDRPDAAGQPTTAGVVGVAKPLQVTLPPGRYMLIVAGDEPSEGSYLLAVARPYAPTKPLQSLPVEPAAGEARCVARYRLPHSVVAGDLGLQGRWLVCRSAQQAWADDLEGLTARPLPQHGGPLRRVALAPDGWTALTVTPEGATVFALPDVVPVVDFVHASGLIDAGYAGRGLRVAVLPRDGHVYLGSPVADDLAWLAGTRGATGLLAAGMGVAVTYSSGEVALFDTAERWLIGRGTWPAPPAQVFLDPNSPSLAGTGPAETIALEVGLQTVTQRLPAARAAAWGPAQVLALATATGVQVVSRRRTVTLAPALDAVAVAFDAAGGRLAAATAEGEVAVWDTSGLTAAEDPTADPLAAARRAYSDGLAKLRAQDWAGAHADLTASLAQLREQPQQGEVLEFVCLALLRLSQASYGAKDWERSLAESDDLLATSAKLPAGELRQANLAQGWYRKADAWWELGRRAEAKAAYQQALDQGLTGPAADDARQKVQAP